MSKNQLPLIIVYFAIGYPDEEKSPHKEEELPYDKVHYNKW